jgi:hypothetical protein
VNYRHICTRRVRIVFFLFYLSTLKWIYYTYIYCDYNRRRRMLSETRNKTIEKNNNNKKTREPGWPKEIGRTLLYFARCRRHDVQRRLLRLRPFTTRWSYSLGRSPFAHLYRYVYIITINKFTPIAARTQIRRPPDTMVNDFVDTFHCALGTQQHE